MNKNGACAVCVIGLFVIVQLARGSLDFIVRCDTIRKKREMAVFGDTLCPNGMVWELRWTCDWPVRADEDGLIGLFSTHTTYIAWPGYDAIKAFDLRSREAAMHVIGQAKDSPGFTLALKM